MEIKQGQHSIQMPHNLQVIGLPHIPLLPLRKEVPCGKKEATSCKALASTGLLPHIQALYSFSC